MARFSFIHAWRKTFAICRMCKVLRVTARGYRAWRCRSISQRQRDDVVLLGHIREQHKLSLQSYGRPRMTEEPQGLGFEVGHHRIGRMMRQNGIQAVRARELRLRPTATTALPSLPTCWSETSRQSHAIINEPATSATYGPAKGGCIWPSSWICILVV